MSEQRIEEIRVHLDEASQASGLPRPYLLSMIRTLARDSQHLLSLLDGKAPTVSEAVEKVKELRDEWRISSTWEGEEYANAADRIITALESLQPSGVVLVNREEAAKTLCCFCTEAERYGPPKEVTGLKHLWHTDLRMVQCQATAIHALPPYGSKQNGDRDG